MLSQLASLARWLQPIKTYVLVLGLGLSVTFIGVLLTTPAGQDDILLPALMGSLWCASVWALIDLFAGWQPAAVDGSWWRRLKGWLRQLLYGVAALMLVFTTLALSLLTTRVLVKSVLL